MRLFSACLAFGLALLLPGCLPELPSSPDGGTQSDGGLPPLDPGRPPAADEVLITNFVPYVTDTETVQADPLELPVEVLVPTAGGYTRLSGTEVATGRGSVRNVPAGPYLVRSGKAYVWTSARSVNRGWARAERPGVPLADATATSAELTLTGLSPWNQGGGYDGLELVTPETGGSAQLYVDPQPQVGATSLAAAHAEMFPFTAATLPQLDPSRDTVVLMQQVAQDVGTPLAYSAVRRAVRLQAPAFDGRAPLRLNAALSALPANPITVDLRGTELCSARAQAHPDATAFNVMFDVEPAAYGLGRYGWVGYSGELLTYLQEASGIADVVASFSYGDPFPASWGRVATAYCIFRHRVTLPSGNPHSLYATMGRADALQSLLSSPVTLHLTPPVGFQVDGSAAAAPRQLASRTPTFSWLPPTSGGTPTSYRLMLYRLTEPGAGGTVRRSSVAIIDLPPTVQSLRLPEGILEPGGQYVMRLAAYRAPLWDITRNETAQTLPNDIAETYSGLLGAP